MRYLILSLFLVLFCRPASLRGGQKGEHQDAERWDRRYDTEKYVYGRDPVQFLKEQIANLGKGKALCLAAGEGRNAVYLAEQGFEVVAVDISTKGLRKCQALAKARGVEVRTVVADLETYEFEHGVYDLITDFYYYQPDLFGDVIKALKPGGKFILETFTVDHPQIADYGPRNPNYLVKPNELLSYFSNHRIRYYEDTIIDRDEGMHRGKRAVVRLVVEKAAKK